MHFDASISQNLVSGLSALQVRVGQPSCAPLYSDLISILASKYHDGTQLSFIPAADSDHRLYLWSIESRYWVSSCIKPRCRGQETLPSLMVFAVQDMHACVFGFTFGEPPPATNLHVKPPNPHHHGCHEELTQMVIICAIFPQYMCICVCVCIQ